MTRWLSRRSLLAAALSLLPAAAPAAPGDEVQKLVPMDGQPHEHLGTSVASQGSTALVGGWGDPFSDVPGVAWLFDLGTGDVRARLQPAGVTPDHDYGLSVALAGGRAFVGAPLDQEAGLNDGAVYVFDASNGQQLDKLFADDPTTTNYYGWALASHGAQVLVGAIDRAFLVDASSGQELLQLEAPAGVVGTRFGAAVALWDTTALVGAAWDEENGFRAGAAYLFDLTTGQQIAKLLPSDAEEEDSFGAAVALGPGYAVVGAPGKRDGTNQLPGAAYLFDPATGQELGRLVRNDSSPTSQLGTSAAIDGATVVVGARGDSAYKGALYVFDAATRQQVAKLRASDGEQQDQLGRSVSIEGSKVVAGAWMDDDNGTDSGSAYVYDVSLGTSVPYCFGDGSGAPCPCGNAGSPWRGCANSAFAEGARLYVTGSASTSGPYTLRVEGSRPSQPGLFFQGDQAVAGGDGLSFGDGLRCAGGSVVRLEVSEANASGSCLSTAPVAQIGGVSPGDVKRYQWWYRDPGASPCGSGFNLSSALAVSWAP